MIQTTSSSGLPPVVSFRGVVGDVAASDHGDHRLQRRRTDRKRRNSIGCSDEEEGRVCSRVRKACSDRGESSQTLREI